jgi:hypothetical protein
MSKKKGGRRPPGDYPVGYGRPPSANQFKPGQSGNPYGRRPNPRRDEPKEGSGVKRAHAGSELDQLIHDELNRFVDAQENGEPVKLSVIQAVIRSMGLSAMKGRTQAQRAIVQLADAANEKEIDRRAYARDLVHNYRRCYPDAVRAFERIYPGKFCYLPHPDDVFYNEDLGIMDFNGPFTEAGWHMMNVEEHLCKQIFIAIRDMTDCPVESSILNIELCQFATRLYNAAEKIRLQLPVRLHAGIEEVKPKDWVPDSNNKGVDLIYFGVLEPVPPGLLKRLALEPMAYDLFCLAMNRLDLSGKWDGVNRTRHCISAFGHKLTTAQRSHALKAISGVTNPATLTRRLWELGRKEVMPGHVICEARLAAARVHGGQEVSKIAADFRESVHAS